MNVIEDIHPRSQSLFQCLRIPIVFIIVVFIMTVFLVLSTYRFNNIDQNYVQPGIALYNQSNRSRLLQHNTSEVSKSNPTTVRKKVKQKSKVKSRKNKVLKIPVAHVNKTYYICPKWLGRLGNQMFQYASFYGIAKQNGMKLAITKNDVVYKTFNISVETMDEYKRNSICKRAKVNKYPIPAYFHNISIPKNAHLKIIGQLQSWKYFSNYEEEIRTQFVFKKEIRTTAKTVKENILRRFSSNKSSVVTTIGVHIRRGDYINEARKTPNSEYLQKARNFYRKRYKNVVFVVCTNPDSISRAWCLDNFVTGNDDTILMSPQSPETDLVFLSQCDNLIITVGTFGWWAAWLNNGTTIYYDFITTDDKRYSKADYIYPGWIGIK